LIEKSVKAGKIKISRHITEEEIAIRVKGRWLINDRVLGLVGYYVEIEARRGRDYYTANTVIRKVKYTILHSRILSKLVVENKLSTLHEEKAKTLFERLEDYYTELEERLIEQIDKQGG